MKKIKMNLFDMDSENYLAHCISSDFALGAGIAREFRRRGVADALNKNYQKDTWDGKGYCLYTDMNGFKGVFNLVTKQAYWHKPTYESLSQALISMKQQMIQKEGNAKVKLAMPAIGCGLDKLKWEKVEEIVNDVFKDTDIDITVCYL